LDAGRRRGLQLGLSYTRFAYSKLTLPQQVSAGAPVPVRVDVMNAGSASGDEVVELYLTKPKVSEVPIRELVGFRRIHLEPGKRSHVELSIDPRALGEVDAAGKLVIVPGSYSVSVGGSQPAAGSGVLSGEINIAGRSDLPR
jgi:beta-glucosidase